MQIQQQFDELPEIILRPEDGAALNKIFEQNGSKHAVCLANHPALMDSLASALASQLGIFPNEAPPPERNSEERQNDVHRGVARPSPGY
jgi:hypothetical protein